MLTGKQGAARLILKPPSEQLYVELLGLEATMGMGGGVHADANAGTIDAINPTDEPRSRLSTPERSI